MVNILLAEGEYRRDVIVAHSCSVHFSLILRSSWKMGFMLEGVSLVIQFANNLVLLSESTQDLQSAVDLLSYYCVIWDLNIQSHYKTKLNPWLRMIQRVLNERASPMCLEVNETELLSNLRQRLHDQCLQR